jgi:carboxymethylenebutenolidase
MEDTTMRRTLGFGLAALWLPLTAGVALAEVKTMEINLKSGGGEVKAFLAQPEGKGPFPGVVVIQEWWGLTDWIKENAKRLAAQGYVALAPDLYHGKVADNPNLARQLMQGLPSDRALRDLEAAVSTLADRDNVKKDKIGVIGWCMGGGFALQLALKDPRIQACVMCYGRVVTEPEKLQPLHATVLGIFGEEDQGITPEAVHAFEAALKKDRKKVAGIHLYKAGHGFMRPGDPGQPNPAYREGPAKEAWKEIDAFFAGTLAGK